MFKILLILCLLSITSYATKEYGYFDILINGVRICKGPKRKDCCASSVELKNGSVIIYDIEAKEDVMPNKGKIVASLKNTQMVRLQMNKPCEHFFIKPLLETIFHPKDDCVISKGHYHYNMDVADVFQKYYSGMFLYGNWTFRSMFFNDECNFLCTITEFYLFPKK